MTQYLILIYDDENAWAGASAAQKAAITTGHADFGAKHGAAIRAGDALQPNATATSIRADAAVTDGPFVETKEALGGYYLIEAADLDEAIAIAKEIPAIRLASRYGRSWCSTER